MTEKGNGYVKWVSLVTISVSLLGLMITVSIFAFAQGIAIDIRAKEGIDRVDLQSQKRYNENRNAISEMLKGSTERDMLIMGDLREIKAKMGISK